MSARSRLHRKIRRLLRRHRREYSRRPPRDAEECVNDTYLRAWNAMPPHKPHVLSTFLGKIIRNLSLNRWRQNTAKKRGGGMLPAVLEELTEVVSGAEDVERKVEETALISAINDFLSQLSPEKRSMFICRYWRTDSVAGHRRPLRHDARRGHDDTQPPARALRKELLKRGFSI